MRGELPPTATSRDRHSHSDSSHRIRGGDLPGRSFTHVLRSTCFAIARLDQMPRLKIKFEVSRGWSEFSRLARMSRRQICDQRTRARSWRTRLTEPARNRGSYQVALPNRLLADQIARAVEQVVCLRVRLVGGALVALLRFLVSPRGRVDRADALAAFES